MLECNYTNKLLGLEDVEIKNVEICDEIMIVSVEMLKKPHACPCCGTLTEKIHDYRIQDIKDLSLQAKETHLRVRKRRFVCPQCNKRFSEDVPFLSRYQRISKRLMAHALDAMREVASLKSVAKRLHLSPGQLRRVFDVIEYPKAKLPEVLSIDEFKGNADGQKFQCVLSDVAEKKVLDILPKRNLADLKR